MVIGMSDSSKNNHPEPPDQRFNPEGVDISLIRKMLDLTPSERLRQLESHAKLMQELRDARDAVPIS